MHISLNTLAASPFAGVEFFICCWQPAAPLTLDGDDSPFEVIRHHHFWAITSGNPHDSARLLRDDDQCQVLFRGYDANRGLHSYSGNASREPLLDHEALQNGVFAYLKADATTDTLTVKTDAFGIAPMFARQLGESYLFASHPQLISLVSDKPDYLAWLSRLQTGFVFDNRSFIRGIERVGAGSLWQLGPGGADKQSWYRLEELPRGDRTITDDSLVEVEQCFQAAMDKCCRLQRQQVILPFSSGYDSRRCFAALVDRQLQFKTVTCQMVNRVGDKLYDVETTLAPQIASAFDVPNEIVPATTDAEQESDYHLRLSLIGTETSQHAWATPLCRWLANQAPAVIFDGLSGDTLGYTGFKYEGLHQSPDIDTQLVLERTTNRGLFKHLSHHWPSNSEYQQQFRQSLERLPDTLNRVELAYLRFRSRRTLSPWLNMMQAPGHVILYPYYDLDYIRTCLQYHPGQRKQWSFQRQCLQRFWPAFYHQPGTRDLPADHPATDEQAYDARRDALWDRFYRSRQLLGSLDVLLDLKTRWLWRLSHLVPPLRKKRSWFLRALVHLVRCYLDTPVFLHQQTADKKAAQQQRSL